MTECTQQSQNPRLRAISQAGVSIWLDDLSRDRLTSGNLARLIATSSVVGVTTNPTIFAGALAKGEAYAASVSELKAAGTSLDETITTLTTDDVREACDLFRPVYDRTSGYDGRVSIEVDPHLAHETDATVEQAKQLWQVVDRPNLLVKIPATQEGLPAITRVLAEGISVNVTLIFSVERYGAVLDAWLEGLRLAREAGQDLSTIHSVASFFVSRVDSEVDKRLDAIGTEEALALKGKAALANARLAYQRYEQALADPRWGELEQAGARLQRPLWASTGVKNPDYDDTMYVTQLVTCDVVNTMPEKTLLACADHAEVSGDTIRDSYVDAAATVQQLEAVGVDLADVCGALESEGVTKFVASWNELVETVQRAIDAVGSAEPR